MRVFKYYLCASLLPPITTLVTGNIQMPSNCGKCLALTIVGSGLVLMILLALNLLYFLLLIDFADKSSKIVIGVIGSFLPATIYSAMIFSIYYHHSEPLSGDFEFFLPSVIATLFVSIWTFIRLSCFNKKTNEK